MEDFIVIDKRRFGICEYGNRNGFPIFYFHGFPGSRLDGDLIGFNNLNQTKDFRIICVDRPGIGLSDFQRNRCLLDWPRDVLLIADYLGLNKFSIFGLSGGGPYALSCAFSIPHRLHTVSVVSGMGPFDFPETKNDKAMIIPKQNHSLRWLFAYGMKMGVTKNPAKLIENVKKTLPVVDLNYLLQDENMTNFLKTFSECYHQGIKGYLHEAKIFRDKWGFSLSNVKAKVNVWHGTKDRNVNIEVAKRISHEIPNSTTHFIENEGHFSLIENYKIEILNGLVD